ncbi:hypothetical protein T265_03051 [Opisthorchis viverrini]|uniref:Uncharacterized protein n=1 Tax=Opisthorchis viverrini TaxID=6198 RepID=A0A075A4S1_OPIVI|nr:hypothetical protein T265_03051 [Opisthorchis viverrini]KER30575.1 hypothetical protein T265_03051 [Opisthorchis viverrini]
MYVHYSMQDSRERPAKRGINLKVVRFYSMASCHGLNSSSCTYLSDPVGDLRHHELYIFGTTFQACLRNLLYITDRGCQ